MKIAKCKSRSRFAGFVTASVQRGFVTEHDAFCRGCNGSTGQDRLSRDPLPSRDILVWCPGFSFLSISSLQLCKRGSQGRSAKVWVYSLWRSFPIFPIKFWACRDLAVAVEGVVLTLACLGIHMTTHSGAGLGVVMFHQPSVNTSRRLPDFQSGKKRLSPSRGWFVRSNKGDLGEPFSFKELRCGIITSRFSESASSRTHIRSVSDSRQLLLRSRNSSRLRLTSRLWKRLSDSRRVQSCTARRSRVSIVLQLGGLPKNSKSANWSLIPAEVLSRAAFLPLTHWSREESSSIKDWFCDSDRRYSAPLVHGSCCCYLPGDPIHHIYLFYLFHVYFIQFILQIMHYITVITTLTSFNIRQLRVDRWVGKCILEEMGHSAVTSQSPEPS